MRTKRLLLTAAAIVAGALTAQAASNVYSVNVVGYAQVAVPGSGALSLMTAPLMGQDGGVNTVAATKILSLVGGENILWWNGAGFYTYNYNPGLVAEGYPSDWLDFDGVIPGSVLVEGTYFAPEPVLTNGYAFFLQNGGDPFTNTFVGTAILSSTNSPIPLAGYGALSMVGSVVPLAGNIQTNTDINLPLVGGENILIWNGAGYYTYNYNPGLVGEGYPSDWLDFDGVIPGSVLVEGTYFAPAPQISIGQGFFYQNGGDPTEWAQNVILSE